MKPCVVVRVLRDLICPDFCESRFPHTQVLRQERSFLHPPGGEQSNSNVLQYSIIYKHFHWRACATWFSTRVTTFIRAIKRGPSASGLLFHITSRGDESSVCHVPRQKRVGTESNRTAEQQYCKSDHKNCKNECLEEKPNGAD
jgi:hypothetical protein